MQARKRRHRRTPFVVPTNNALYSALAAPCGIAVLAMRDAGFTLS